MTTPRYAQSYIITYIPTNINLERTSLSLRIPKRHTSDPKEGSQYCSGDRGGLVGKNWDTRGSRGDKNIISHLNSFVSY
jgi:hypothetical protein